jgi:manganese transport system ATP-binding protein
VPPVPVEDIAVTARGLQLAYGDRVALTSSDLDIPAGAVTAVIGPNGSGKSTLLHAIAGLLEPVAGELGVLVSYPKHRGTAYVLQSTKVHEEMPITVREVVSMGRYRRLGMFGRFHATDRTVCRSAMERLDVLDLADLHLDELSGGQRQRVFVAQGLAQEGDLLLLDEPITGLDIVSRDRILEAVAAERERGATVVMSTHDLSEAAGADHVVLLSGRVVASGTPQEVLTADCLTKAYGIKLITTADGTVVLDDPYHRVSAARHLHFDRTGHADHGGPGQGSSG